MYLGMYYGRILIRKYIAVSIVIGSVLDGQVLIPRRARDFSLLHGVQTGSGNHPSSY
jgi:hypothetical protein